MNGMEWMYETMRYDNENENTHTNATLADDVAAFAQRPNG